MTSPATPPTNFPTNLPVNLPIPALILNVDDDDGARYAKTRILQVAGFNVIEAANGADALALVESRTPDLVLLDVKLPDINGLEVCRRIKAEPSSATVLVLQTSAALTGRADKVRGLEGGADNYLAAPIGADELVANVNALLRLRHTQAALVESQERFRELAENITDVFWMFSLDEHALLYVSPAYELLWGRTLSTLTDDAGAWLAAVHPEDIIHVRNSFDAMFSEQRFDEQYRITLPSGQLRWVRDRAFPVRDASGEFYRMARITSDITATKEAERALREADLHKDEFIATLAHELRNPLGPIRNAIAVMRQVAPPELKPLSAAYGVVSRQVDHMAHLINDLLDVARISHGKIALKMAQMSVDDILEAALETSVPFIEERGHVLEVSKNHGNAILQGDAIRLAQALGNLLHNAAKYTPYGGTIKVATTAGPGNMISITVSDNGIGIPVERASSIFQMFAQGDTAPDRAQDGLGIGLPLVRQIAELHKGAVRMESPGQGQGSAFVLVLPAEQAVREDGATEDAAGGDSTEASVRKVLIVDDNADAAEMMAMLLSSYGHQVQTAGDAESTLRIANEFVPDVILLDIGLPGTDGYTVARILRRDPRFLGTILIALTGYGSARDRERSLESGFDHHVVKPAQIDQLLALIGTPDE